MNILLMTQYFHPEPGAPTNRLLSFARGLANKGHRVTVICEFPCYPTGKLAKEDRLKFFRKEALENFTVFRAFVIPTRRSNLLARLVNYLSFMVSSFIVGLFVRRPDLILASSPPLFVGPSAVLLSILKRVPLVADIRDLWPEDAIMLGHLKNPMAILGGRLAARTLYDRATFLITISNGYRLRLQQSTRGKQVITVYNGSSVPDCLPHHKPKTPTTRNDRTLVCYSGTLGLSQPIEDIIEAANASRDDSTIEYLIIGDGVRREPLMRLSQLKGLANLRFTGGVPFGKSLDHMKNCDIAVVALCRKEIFFDAIPSKFFDCMALGLPVILGVDGEARRLLEENQTGLFYHSGDWKDLVEKIYLLKNNPELARKFGDNGRRLVYERFRRSILAEQLEKLLSERFAKKSLGDR